MAGSAKTESAVKGQDAEMDDEEDEEEMHNEDYVGETITYI